MDFDTMVKLAVYQATAETGTTPAVGQVSQRVDARPAEVAQAYGRLAARRLLVLEPDQVTIRMAPPFSGIPTEHQVFANGVRYYANCAWDALGIVAALKRPAEVRSRCAQSLEPLRLAVGRDGPEPSSWLFHSRVPAARWWQDIVFT